MTEKVHSEIKSLTGLRGIAAIYVALYHFKAPHLAPNVLAPFFQHGYLAVDLFFVLSGFVMALTYHHLFKDKFTITAFKKFMGRRIARIYPLYLVMTVTFIIFYCLVPSRIPQDVELSTMTILSNLFMVQAWNISPSIVSAGWSISTEFAAYLVFPFLVIFILSNAKYLSHLIAVICMMVIFILSQSSLGSIYSEDSINNLNIWHGYTPYPLIRCLCEFTIGIWAYRLYIDSKVSTNKIVNTLQADWVSAVLATMVVFFLSLQNTDAVVVCLIPFLIISLANDTSPISRIIGWKPIYLLGVISYSLYLCHLMIHWIRPELIELLIKYQIPHLYFLAFIIQVMISLILGSFFYLCVEKPGRIFFRGLLK